MSTVAPVKPQMRFPSETWARIKAEACAGVSYPVLSSRYGPQKQVISNRAKAEQWPTPARLARRRKEMDGMGNGVGAAPAESNPKQSAPITKDNQRNLVANATNSLLQVTCDSPISRFQSALLALVAAPPADFQSAFAGVAQAAIAEGIRDVPSPRSIKELSTWFDLWRKSSGLDAKASAPGNVPLVNPLRTVSRRAGPVVDAVPVHGSVEFEAWEV